MTKIQVIDICRAELEGLTKTTFIYMNKHYLCLLKKP